MDFDFFKIHTLFWVKKYAETAISSHGEQKMHPLGEFSVANATKCSKVKYGF